MFGSPAGANNDVSVVTVVFCLSVNW